MQIVPLQAVPNQTVRCLLGGQSCRIKVYQKSTGLFLDLYVNDTLTIGGVLCWVSVKLVRSAYLGFSGELAFFDTQPGDGQPSGGEVGQITSSLIGSRFFLAYVPA